MHNRLILLLAAVTCALLPWAGCKDDKGTKASATTGDILIGHYGSLTRLRSHLRPITSRGVKLAMDGDQRPPGELMVARSS